MSDIHLETEVGIPAAFPYNEITITENIIRAEMERDPVRAIVLASQCVAFSETRGVEKVAADVWASRMKEAIVDGGSSRRFAMTELRSMLDAPVWVEGPMRMHARKIRNSFDLKQ